MKLRPILSLGLFLALPALAADRIYLTDGSVLEGKVGEESFLEVAYKNEDGKARTLAADTILRIEYERKPTDVDQADVAAGDGALLDAVDMLEEYLAQYPAGKRDRKHPWAPAYAYTRVVELKASMGDAAGAIEAADRLIKTIPNARQVPEVFLTKAAAQVQAGKAELAQRTLSDLQNLIDAQGLSERWRLECRLGLVRSDASLSPDDRRSRLDDLASEAGSDFPTVRNRARVAIGESWLEGDAPDFGKAQGLFQEIADDPKADNATLAGAYVGLGDCIFQEAAQKVEQDAAAAAPMLRAALMNYLRVVVLYEGQTRYRPKALYFAGRCYDLMQDTDETAPARARDLFRAVLREYPGTAWAAEAEKRI